MPRLTVLLLFCIFLFSFSFFFSYCVNESSVSGCALTHSTVRLKFYCPTEWKNGEWWTLRWIRKFPSHSVDDVHILNAIVSRTQTRTSDFHCAIERVECIARAICSTGLDFHAGLSYADEHIRARSHILAAGMTHAQYLSTKLVNSAKHVNVVVAVVERVCGARFFNSTTQAELKKEENNFQFRADTSGSIQFGHERSLNPSVNFLTTHFLLALHSCVFPPIVRKEKEVYE